MFAAGVFVALGAAQAVAQRAAPAPAGPASLAGRWQGTFTSDVTQKGGQLVLTLTGSDESASGTIALTPTGARAVVMAENAAPPARGQRAPAGLPVTLMKTGEDQVSGAIDVSFMDPSCNCSVIASIEGTISGNTMTGSLSARDSRTGQWRFTSFTARKAGR
jgi:hypothetical protein